MIQFVCWLGLHRWRFYQYSDADLGYYCTRCGKERL